MQMASVCCRTVHTCSGETGRHRNPLSSHPRWLPASGQALGEGESHLGFQPLRSRDMQHAGQYPGLSLGSVKKVLR